MRTFNKGAVKIEQDSVAGYGLPAGFWVVSVPVKLLGGSAYRVVVAGRVESEVAALARAAQEVGLLAQD